MTNYTKFAIKGTIIVLVTSLLAAFLGYLVRLVMARNLSVEDFGLFNSVFAFLGTLGIFKSLGFDKALIKFIPEFLHERRKDFIKSSIIYVVVIQLVTNTIIIFAVYLLSNYLSVNFFHSLEAKLTLKLLAIAFYVDSFVLVLKFAFQGFKEMAYYSGIDAVRMFLVLVVTFIGFKLNYGLLSPVAGYVITPLILLFFYGWIFIKDVFPDFVDSEFVFDKSLLKKISKYSIFVVETTAAGMLLYYTDILALTYFSDLKNVGLYSVALPTAKVLIYFPRAVGGILIPLTAELWVKKKEILLKAGIESLYKYSLIIIIPLVFIMFSFADLVIILLYGKSYVLAATAMKILSIGMIFAVIYAIDIDFFAGIGQTKINSKMVFLGAIFNLILNLILIPLIGINGAAIATTTSYFVMMIYGLMKIRKFIDVHFPLKIWIKSISAGIIFVLIISILKKLLVLNVWLETGITLTVAGLCYVGLLFGMKIVDVKELKDIYMRLTSK